MIDCNYIHNFLNNKTEIAEGEYGKLYDGDYIKKDSVIKEFEAYKTPLEVFKNEVAILKKLNKSKITPKIYSSWKCDKYKKLYIQIEKIHGITLKSYILQELPFTLDDGLILKTIIDILHENKIYHSDLHSENIMVSYNNLGITDFKIIDFGTSKICKKLEFEKDDDFYTLYVNILTMTNNYGEIIANDILKKIFNINEDEDEYW